MEDPKVALKLTHEQFEVMLSGLSAIQRQIRDVPPKTGEMEIVGLFEVKWTENKVKVQIKAQKCPDCPL